MENNNEEEEITENLEKEESLIKERKDKIQKKLFGWVKDNYDKIFLVILVAAFILRLWIFFRTMDQAIWWDAADYLSTAKKWGLGLDMRETWYYRRGFFWPLFGALLFKLGLGEISIRFSIVLFSTGIVGLTYFIIKELFEKKLALYATIGVAFSWVILFFTGRPLTSIPATFFLLLSLLFFIKGYYKGQGNKYLYLFGVFYALAALTRMQYLLFIPFFLLIFFIKEKFRFFKNKHLWVTLIIFLLVLSPHIFLYWKHFGNPVLDIMAFNLGIGGVTKAEVTSQRNFSDMPRYFFDLPYILTNPILILFLIGAFFLIADIFLGLDKIFTNKKTQKNLLVFAWIVILFAAIGYVSAGVEQRYIMPSIPFLFLIAAIPLIKLEKLIQKTTKLNKNIITIIIFVIAIAIMIPNFTWGNELIDNKKNSYYEIKQAGEWIKENSEPSDIIISASLPHTLYYSERSTYPINLKSEAVRKQTEEFQKYKEMDDKEAFEDLVSEKNPKYLILSALEVHPQWILSYPEEHQDVLTPVQAFYQGENPIVIIYMFQNPINLSKTTENPIEIPETPENMTEVSDILENSSDNIFG